MTGLSTVNQRSRSDTPIPGPDPGACPKCGEWVKAGIPHVCLSDVDQRSRREA